MASLNESDEIPMLPISDPISTSSLSNPTSSINVVSSYTGPLRTRRLHSSVQMTAPPMEPSDSTSGVSSQPKRYSSFDSLERKPSSEDESVKKAHLMRSERLRICNDPYCTTYPSYDNRNAAQRHTSRVSAFFDSIFHDARGKARRFVSSVTRYFPETGIIKSHAGKVQTTKFFALSCFLAIFIDPLFFFLVRFNESNKCIVIEWTMTYVFVAVRSLTNFFFVLNICLQFRLPPKSKSGVVGVDELVDQPKKVGLRYLRGEFVFDFITAFPLPQVVILCLVPRNLDTSRATQAKNVLIMTFNSQYFLKLGSLLHLCLLDKHLPASYVRQLRPILSLIFSPLCWLDILLVLVGIFLV